MKVLARCKHAITKMLSVSRPLSHDSKCDRKYRIQSPCQDYANAELNESAAACPDNDDAAEAALLHLSIVDCGALQWLFNWPQIKSATTAIPRADPWLKVFLSAGSKESVLRPSKPAPKTIKGDEPLQDPRSRLLVLAVVVEVLVALAEVVSVDPESETTAVEPEHVSVDAVDVDVAVAAATAATVDDASAAVVAVAEAAAVADPLTPAEARAALISSAVTSATRRF